MESLNTLRQEWNWVLQRNTRMVWSKIRKRSGRGDVLNRIVKEEVNEEMAFEPSFGRNQGPSRASSGRETGSAKAPGEDCALRGLAGRERKGGRGGKEEVIKAIGVQSCMNSQSPVQT